MGAGSSTIGGASVIGATDIGITGALTTGAASQQGPAGMISGVHAGAGKQAVWQAGVGAQLGVGAQAGAGLQIGAGLQTMGAGAGHTGAGAGQEVTGLAHLLVVSQLDAQVPLPLVLQRMRFSKPPA